MSLAPIVLFVYNRPWHTQQTIESLQRNIYADESELFIFSDGPKNNSDSDKVAKVREYINSVGGFKKVEIISQNKNLGLATSIISGVSGIINRFNKIIVLEDDLVSSPLFLKFLNKGLEFYEKNNKFFCITGYNYPKNLLKIPQDYPYNVYISPRNDSWGWATWNDRWSQADWEVTDFNQLLLDKNLQRQFNYGGNDLFPMLQSQMSGTIDSWSIRWCYTMFKNGGYCIYPVQSFINNIGCDGTGVHCDNKNRFQNFALNEEDNFHFPENIQVDDRIMNEFQKIFDDQKNLKYRISSIIKRYLH